jgi:hypothetical protein
MELSESELMELLKAIIDEIIAEEKLEKVNPFEQ